MKPGAPETILVVDLAPLLGGAAREPLRVGRFVEALYAGNWA